MCRWKRYFMPTRTWSLWLVTLVTLACAGYGKMRPSSMENGDMRAFIDTHFQDLDAAYCGNPTAPTAILMDRKSDSVRLGGEGWTPINEKDQLVRMVSAMQRKYWGWGHDGRGPRLSDILDATGRPVGYLYSVVYYTTVRPHGVDYTVDTVTLKDVREFRPKTGSIPKKRASIGELCRLRWHYGFDLLLA